ncbi:hypothetical protein C8Q80DRAFT_1273371 [Daedaleopsis nitida]|nr:hypothetical protein C8Q80DRAFT_1273371 [Daedaleopsis nitida]
MYNSSNFSKSQASSDAPALKYRSEVKHLQEAFPAWSYDDLQTLLTEVNGDVQVAADRISEGRAEQWGSVTRKKDKKLTSNSTHFKDSSANRERGDFRGGRGGRAARGGPRGGAARGASARGGHHEVNGHRAKPSVAGQTPNEAPAADGAAPSIPNEETTDTDPEGASAWGSSTPPTWGGDTSTINGSATHSAPAPIVTPVAAPAPAQAHSPAPAKVVSTPATSKLSWAQIARKPQEKPVPPPAPVPQPAPVSVPTPPPAPAQQLESTPPQRFRKSRRRRPAPTWDDEPRPPPQTESISAPEEPKPAEPITKPVEEPIPDRIHAAGPPGVVQQPAPESPAGLPPKPLTPSISTRPTPVSHRTNPKFKTTDQPVVLPASFGSGLEKIGMQFGSLSLGGEDFDASPHDIVPVEQTPPQAPAPEPAPVPTPVAAAPEPVAPIASPPTQTSLASTPLFQTSISQPTQQPQPQQTQQPPALPISQQASQSSIPSSLSQPALSTQSSLPTSTAASSISSYSQPSQPSLSSHQSQPQSQTHHSYGQHGLPAHLDQVQSQPQHNAPVSQPQQPQPALAQLGGPSSYFRQAEAPYFHTPTPPAGQSQDSPYGAFGQLGQVQHQGQGSHLGNFSGGDYAYGESQRNFYDSYSGPTGFNRNVLGHDDIKSLPGSQQPHAAPGLPPASAQSSQQHPPSSQSSSQGQPSAGQGPQQGYPPPVPYYYPYPQSQYYGSPYNSSYTVPQPFVKYPVFQGPPGPQSAPSPATKQGPSSVQPQSPYGQSLYGQQPHSNAYDDIGYQHHNQHSVGQNVNVGSGLPSGEYGKHQHGSLYGGSGQGMQGFMGLGQSSAPTSGPPLGQRAAAGSPENAYKPYGGGVKDVGAGVGVGQGGVGQGPQVRGGVQQPGQGSFYTQRFAGSQSGGPQGQQAQQPQGQGPQGHLGYPQGGSEGSTFYSYQPRQQQYWQ